MRLASHTRQLGCFCLCLLIYSGLQAQVDTTFADPGNLDQAIEDLILNTETDEQVDYTDLSIELEELRARPLDLNRCSREDLLLLPGMNPLMAEALLGHIDRYGKLTSIYELQAIPGYRIAQIREWLPYIRVTTAEAQDISPGSKHPRGPKLNQLMQELKFELLQRWVWIAEAQKGYSDPDTTFREIFDREGRIVAVDTSFSTRYLGAPYRMYTRFRARSGSHLSFGLIGEKDPGEPFRWEPGRGYLGYDYLSGFVSLRDMGKLKRLVVGDYMIEAGQGMVLSRGLGFGKGAQVINAVKMANRGLRPYQSVNENQFLRGAAATYAWGDLYATAFFSHRGVDASVQALDTLTNEAISASSLQLSGLHRTPSELANRRSIRETLAGGRVEYKTRFFTLGTTHYQQHFSSPIERNFNDYNAFDFRGDQNHLTSLDFDAVLRNFNFFGEVARSRSGGTGAVVGFMSSLAPTVDVSVLARRYERDFHSSKAYVFAERPTAAQNETGLYLGIQIVPKYGWTISTYFDQYYFPWNKFRAAFPSRGWEYMAQVSHRPRRGTEIYLRFRTDHKQVNAKDAPPGQQLQFLVPTRRDQLRLHVQTRIERNIYYRTRLEFSWYRQETERHRGFLLYQDLIWRWGFRFRLTGRYALFDAPDYDARIYAYENDILGFFSIPAYYRTGSRWYLIANWKINRQLETWLRVSQWRIRDDDRFGSGLEEVVGPKRTEVKLQFRWAF